MKNIVICSYGTGNEYGENNTNVVETYAICEKTPSQVVFYDPGVGTGGFGSTWKAGNRVRSH
jgi:uncharacterized protein (DUF2235 family)